MTEKTIIIILIAVIALLFIWLFRKPIKFILKMLLNILLGFVVLVVINLLGAGLGIALGINWINAVIVAILGLPGVILLLVVQWLL